MVDLGSGAGFPGLVLAIIGEAAGRDITFHLVESDARKAAFLAEAARAARVGGAIKIHTVRAEALAGRMAADVVTARALAPLDRLFGLAKPLVEARRPVPAPQGRDGGRGESTAAEKRWKFQLERFPSKSDSGGAVLAVRGLAPK